MKELILLLLIVMLIVLSAIVVKSTAIFSSPSHLPDQSAFATLCFYRGTVTIITISGSGQSILSGE